MIPTLRTIPLSLLRRAPWNYKHDNPELQKKLDTNMKRNGQVETLLVRHILDTEGLDTGEFEVVNGNHRLGALDELGAPVAICIDLGAIPYEDAVRIAIEINETRFATNAGALAELMKGLSREHPLEELAETMPFERAELDNLISSLELSWERIKEDTRQAAQEGADEGIDPEDDSEVGPSGERFSERLHIAKMPEETWNLWRKWVDRYRKATKDDNESRAFEYAIIEATNG